MTIQPDTASTPKPLIVLDDTAPDGTPQVMLITPRPETILDRDTALTLIADLTHALTC